MKKILVLIFIIGILFIITGIVEKMNIDKKTKSKLHISDTTERLNIVKRPKGNLYIGNTIDQVISQLGNPTEDIFHLINENYRGYEEEPVYSDYFTQDELHETITVRIVKWRNNYETIAVWSRNISDKWEIFHSIKWNIYTNF